MSAEEILAVIREARAVLNRISPPQSGKSQHRCELCRATGAHPCPIFEAMILLFTADSVAYHLKESK